MAELAFTEDVAEASAAVGPFLRQDPAVNNVALMLLARQADLPEPVARFWWLGRGHDIAGLCFQVGAERGVHINICSGPLELASRLAITIANTCPDVPGVDGPVGEAAAFAGAWAAERHVPVTMGMFQRYYLLNELIAPPSGAGQVRLATTDDFDTVMPWAIAFQQEALHDSGRNEGDHRSTVDVAGLAEVLKWKLDHGEIWLLDDEGPQCMVGASVLVDGVSRIHLVYTPPEIRGRGLGTRCTAGAVTETLKRGASHCVLFTDLANPTSNAVYQRLGFKPHCEYLNIDFG